jgi:outer membrane immunogenic protein
MIFDALLGLDVKMSVQLSEPRRLSIFRTLSKRIGARPVRAAIGIGVCGFAFSSLLVAASAADLTPVARAANPGMLAAEAASPPARQFSCYLGILAEAVAGRPEFANVPLPGDNSVSSSFGARGGGVTGCEFLFQTRTFLGVDLTAAYGGLKGDLRGFKYSLPWEGAGRVRLGYMLSPDVSTYIAGGFAFAYLDTTDVAGVTGAGSVAGGQLAAGLEYRFAPVWRARGEYAFTWYGSDTTLMTGYPFARMNPITHSFRVAIMRVFNL